MLNRQRRFPLRARGLADFTDAVLDYLGQMDREVAVMLVPDRKIRAYNARFLNHDWPTDVLSFPYMGNGAGPQTYLGDIIISVETAARNARRYRLSVLREIKNLVIHGIVHLLGYDHTTDRGQMRALEQRVRRALYERMKSCD